MKIQNTDILKYRVVQIDTSDPMYGKDKVLSVHDTEDMAIKRAKLLISKGKRDIGVFETVYTSERNLSRGFSLKSSLVWGDWL